MFSVSFLRVAISIHATLTTLTGYPVGFPSLVTGPQAPRRSLEVDEDDADCVSIMMFIIITPI